MNNFIAVEAAQTDLLSCAAFVAERIGSADGYSSSVADVALRFAAKGELDLAAQLADSISDPHTRDLTLTEIAARCADFNDDEYGFQLVEAIEDYGFQQNALHVLAARQAQNGRLEDALASAERMDDPYTTLGEVAARFAEAGDEARAREILEKIDFPSVRVQVLNQIAAARTKREESAVEVLDESLTETEEIEFDEERTQLLLEIATFFLNAGETERAKTVLEKTKNLAESLEPRFRDQALAQTALLYARAGDFERAGNILEPIEDLQQTASAHAGLALEHAAQKDLERAAAELEEAYAVLKSQPEREIRDSKSRFNLFAMIALHFARIGKAERGLEVAQENPDDEPRSAALTNIAAVCAAQEGKDELARQAANSIEDHAQQVFAFIGISDAENKSGRAEQSMQTLTEARALTEEIGRLSLRSEALNAVAVRCSELGDDDRKAREILHESLQAVGAINDQAHQSAALAALAEVYEQLKIELADGELEIADSIVRKRLSAV